MISRDIVNSLLKIRDVLSRLFKNHSSKIFLTLSILYSLTVIYYTLSTSYKLKFVRKKKKEKFILIVDIEDSQQAGKNERERSRNISAPKLSLQQEQRDETRWQALSIKNINSTTHRGRFSVA